MLYPFLKCFQHINNKTPVGTSKRELYLSPPPLPRPKYTTSCLDGCNSSYLAPTASNSLLQVYFQESGFSNAPEVTSVQYKFLTMTFLGYHFGALLIVLR